MPGRSAQARFDELHAQRAARLEQSWGRLAGIAKLLSPDPRSTTNWRRGAEGERVVAGQLERALGDRATLLCDRRIPHSNANIDLLAVAASGVWIVDVKHWSGKVEVRDVGAWRKTDRRLYVAGRDRSNAVDGLERQVVAVRRALYGRDVPLVACMCFTGAEWGLFARPFKVGAVRVTWTRKLAEMILEGGRLEPATVASIATALARRLPAK